MFIGIVAGFVEAAAGVVVGAWGYEHWHRPPPSLTGENAEAFVHGASSYLVFVLASPFGWIALWLFVEGLLRVLASAMQQPFSTLPVVAARAAWSLKPKAKLPDDLVRPVADGWVVESARDLDWHRLTTVEIDGALYVAKLESGTALRPYRYQLTPIPHDHVVRSVRRYR